MVIVEGKNHIPGQENHILEQKEDVCLNKNHILGQENHVLAQKEDVPLMKNHIPRQENHVLVQKDDVPLVKNHICLGKYGFWSHLYYNVSPRFININFPLFNSNRLFSSRK